MLLSILIPTYNYVCVSLVKMLHRQLPDNAEIIVGDDGSTDIAVRQQNRAINSMDRCRVWEATENMGRAGIRNQLARLAQGQWLLFMDSDALVQRTDFVSKYLDACNRADVVCGGMEPMAECPSPQQTLRYRYDRAGRELLSCERRTQHPYQHFSTFNFMIRRKVFMGIQFDASMRQYGYEDAFFGLSLRTLQVPILHIDNPAIHAGLDSNEEFLQKTETAMQQLHLMPAEYQTMSPLCMAHMRLKRFCLAPCYRLFFRVFRGAMRRHLAGANPSITIFQMYKLGYYMRFCAVLLTFMCLHTAGLQAQEVKPQVLKLHMRTGEVKEFQIDDIEYLEINDQNHKAVTDSVPHVGGRMGKPVDLGLSVQWADVNVGAHMDVQSGGRYTADENVAQYWADGWRLPTEAEWRELMTQCRWTWTVINGVSGRLVTARNGSSIFLPASGLMLGENLILQQSIGLYATDGALQWYFDSANVYDIELPRTNRYSFRLVR